MFLFVLQGRCGWYTKKQKKIQLELQVKSQRISPSAQILSPLTYLPVTWSDWDYLPSCTSRLRGDALMRYMDRRTDNVIPIYPTKLVCWVIITPSTAINHGSLDLVFNSNSWVKLFQVGDISTLFWTIHLNKIETSSLSTHLRVASIKLRPSHSHTVPMKNVK